MQNYIIVLILLNALSFTQDASTENIFEDHDKAVDGILANEIKKQTEIVNEALTKQSNDVLFSQATYSFLGTIGTIILEANNESNLINLTPMVMGHTIVPLLEMREINNSKEPESLKKMRKSRVRVNSMLGSIPIAKWIIVMLRMPKALLDIIF